MAERCRRSLRLRGKAAPAPAMAEQQHKRGSEEATDDCAAEHVRQSCKKSRCRKMLVTSAAARRTCYYCPNHSCNNDGAFASPARLLDHFRTAHPYWSVTPVTFGTPCEVALPLHVLIGGEADRDQHVFLVCSSSSEELVVGPGRRRTGTAVSVSVVCVRNNNDDGDGAAPQFNFTLVVQRRPPAPGGNCVGKVSLVGLTVPSSGPSGGLVAAERLASVRLSSDLLVHGAYGEAPRVMVCIDKAGCATPPETGC